MSYEEFISLIARIKESTEVYEGELTELLHPRKLRTPWAVRL